MTGLLLVSGMTRSGSSLLMQMLHAGGFPVVPGHTGWPAFESPMNMGRGRLPKKAAGAMKWLDPQEWKPPRAVLSVYLGRDKLEQAKSLVKFTSRLFGFPVEAAHVVGMEAALRADELRAIKALHGAGPVLVTSFEDLLARPADVLAEIAARTGTAIDVPAALAQLRPRTARCLPYLLEERLMDERALETAAIE